MNGAPDTHQLKELRAKRIGWVVILGEFLDNAIDARATEIRVVFGAQKLVVIDNGVGIEDFELLFRQGVHGARPYETMGRFGVGFKHAAGKLWGITSVVSVHGGQRRSVMVNWQKWMDSGSWRLPDPAIEPAPSGAKGTELRFTNIELKTKLQDALDELEFMFAPARASGVTISVTNGGRPRIFREMVWPEIVSEVTQEVYVEGKLLTIRAGIVPTDVRNPRSGLHYSHLHRIIESSELGCGDYGTSRIFGIVTLVGPEWALSTNKERIGDNDREAVDEAVFQVMEPLLKEAHEQARQIDLSDVAANLTGMLRAAVGGREQRDAGDESGTVEEQDTDRKRRQATKVHAEGTIPRRRSGGVKVDFGELTNPSHLCSVAGRQIKLNNEHPWVHRQLAHGAEGEQALFVAALAAYLDSQHLGIYGQGDTSFAETMGRWVLALMDQASL
jgi:hypothetical protein